MTGTDDQNGIEQDSSNEPKRKWAVSEFDCFRSDVEYRPLAAREDGGERWPEWYRVGSDGSVWSRIKKGYQKKGCPEEFGPWRRLRPRIVKGSPRLDLTLDKPQVNGQRPRYSAGVSWIVCRTFHGPRPIGCEPLHYPDPDITNNQSQNLRWAPINACLVGQPKPYVAEISRRLRPRAVLTDDQVVRLREAYAAGFTCEELACEFGIAVGSVWRIASGGSYGHVPGAIKKSPNKTKGSDQYNATLNERAVKRIRLYASKGESFEDIAQRFRVSPGTVSRIYKGEAWGHVAGEIDKSRRNFGVNHPSAKLSESNVREILKLHLNGIKQSEIAARFSVTPTLIRAVCKRKIWKHVSLCDSE